MGTVINAAAVIIGGTIGMLVKGGLPLSLIHILLEEEKKECYTKCTMGRYCNENTENECHAHS